MIWVREKFSVLLSRWLVLPFRSGDFLMSSNFSGLLKRSRDGTVTSTPWGCLVQSRGIVGRTCGEVIANWRCWRWLKIANHILCVLTFALRLDNCPTQIVNQLFATRCLQFLLLGHHIAWVALQRLSIHAIVIMRPPYPLYRYDPSIYHRQDQ